MTRVGLVIACIGGVLAFFGYQEYQVGAGTSSNPVPVALVDLESGIEPPDKHLQIGEHWAIFPSWVGWGDEDSDQLDYIYYPIVSDNHPYNQEWDALIAKYGDEEILENEHPQLTSLSVLVKSTRYNLVGAVPSEWTQVDSITGLLIDDIEKLKSGEEQSLRESYPDWPWRTSGSSRKTASRNPPPPRWA